MTLIAVKTGWFGLLLGLTPEQKWDAVTKYHTSTSANQLFTMLGVGIIGILLVLLLISIYRRATTRPAVSAGLFAQYAREKQLTDREYRILSEIVIFAKLKREEAIFQLPSAFERGAAEMALFLSKDPGNDPARDFAAEIALLREKLGFQRFAPAAVSAENADSQGSRTIGLKKKIYVKRLHRPDGDLEATVIKNTPTELTVEFANPVEVFFGQPWVCRYYSGSYVAEFKTTPLKCSGPIVVLKHSNQIRQVNRRRFQRVPVRQQAYVASFPFQRNPLEQTTWLRQKLADLKADQKTPVFELPKFYPAIVTEIGGPGLRLETKLKATVGDRLIVLFRSTPNAASGASVSRRAAAIYEDIAEVRHIETKANHVSIMALELPHLNDSQIGQLICAANEAAAKTRNSRPAISDISTLRNRKRELLPV